MVAITRLALTALFLAEWLFFSGVLSPPSGTPTYWIGLSAFVLGVGYSAWALRWQLRQPQLGRGQLIGSVTVDAVIIGMILVPQVIWPKQVTIGLLHAPDLAILLLATIAAGVRLSRIVFLVGAGLMVALFCLVNILLAVQGNLNAMHAGNTATWSLYLVGAVVLGYSIATRTRRMVFEGAETALVAERTRQRFGAYVSEEIAQEAIDAEEITLGGRRQPVAVLFSDLRGFTSYSEHVPPEQLIAELNNYLGAMVAVIREEGGVVDKFIGDAIMVVFGIPKPGPDDARRAIRAAAAMQSALVEHNVARASAGKPPFAHGIGVHFGPAVAGHVGNAERLQYTVVGDVVNVASRLESATKSAGASVLISAAAVEAAEGDRHPPLKSLGHVEIPGHEQNLKVYTLTSLE